MKLGPYQIPGFYTGDCRELLQKLPEESVHCIVTSPPYWGLRVYAGEQATVWGGIRGCPHDWRENERRSSPGGLTVGPGAQVAATKAGVQRGVVQEAFCSMCGAWRGGYGNEPTPEMYVEHTLDVMHELWRVLRDDGVLFLNIGDTYVTGNYGCRSAGGVNGGRVIGTDGYLPHGFTPPNRRPHSGIPRKSLALIPYRIALAAQSEGWIVRSDVIWHKTNAMPESVQDRPTRAHEYVFVMAKSPRYFWDADAVMETAVYGVNPRRCAEPVESHGPGMPPHRGLRASMEPGAARNARSVWSMPTCPYKGSHFAVFPPELPTRCIRVATSPRVCSSCGAPWRRAVERTPMMKTHGAKAGEYGVRTTDCLSGHMDEPAKRKTVGWEPACDCDAGTQPAVVLDPFFGSGTVGRVAEDLGRHWIGFDISDEYRELQAERTGQVSLVAGLEGGEGW